jgi:hypothetical protein
MLAALLAGSLLAAPAPGDAPDTAFDAPLHALYDGSSGQALGELKRLSDEFPADPLPPYFEALATAWRIEERPERRDDDALLIALADAAIARSEARLGRNRDDLRALFGRGAAHGVKSRLALYRHQRGESAREAVRMRDDLKRVLELDPAHADARFGLALYDYYADVLPRALRLLRFLLGIPGGDRERGLLGLEEAARSARFHRREAQSQLYEIHAYYEDDPDAALANVQALYEDFPGSPLWGLKLAEHLRLRLGRFAQSAAIGAGIAARADAGEPNFAPVVGALGRLRQAEALADDLRFDAARAVLDALAPALPAFPALKPPAADVRDAVLRRAADPAWRALARSRRCREAHDAKGTLSACREVLVRRPADLEAGLCVAELESPASAGAEDALLDRILHAEDVQPPDLAFRARLVEALRAEARGKGPEAVVLYKEVFERPGGAPERRESARRALERLGAAPEAPLAASPQPNHSR